MKSFLRGDSLGSALSLMMVSLVGMFAVSGCAASEEEFGEGRVRSPLQMTIDSLKNENTTLKQMNAKLEADRRSLNAHVAELETSLMMERERVAQLTPPPRPQVTDPTGLYQEGLAKFKNRDYQGAADLFTEVLSAGESSGLADNAHYWIGECLYGMKRYNEALDHFRDVFNYVVSEKKDDSQLMTAHCYLRLGNSTEAKVEFQKLVDEYPTSEYLQRAKDEMARLR